jgi:SAM-dependent methyltransferase
LSPEAIADDRAYCLAVGACLTCGLVQLGEKPDLVYSTDYFCSVNFSAHSRAYQSGLAQRWTRDHQLAGERVLEIGSGDGFFADLLAAQGCEVTLPDPAPRACEAARQRGHRNVIEGEMTGAILPGTPFDALVARHVLEHEIVYGIRKMRQEGILLRSIRKAYYNLIAKVANIHLVPNALLSLLYSLIALLITVAFRGELVAPGIPTLIVALSSSRVSNYSSSGFWGSIWRRSTFRCATALW